MQIGRVLALSRHFSPPKKLLTREAAYSRVTRCRQDFSRQHPLVALGMHAFQSTLGFPVWQLVTLSLTLTLLWPTCDYKLKAVFRFLHLKHSVSHVSFLGQFNYRATLNTIYTNNWGVSKVISNQFHCLQSVQFGSVISYENRNTRKPKLFPFRFLVW